MKQYVALLRGVNVGGKALLPMAALREALEGKELKDVRTYIQSGNVIFASSKQDTHELADQIEHTINTSFGLHVPTVVFEESHWQRIIDTAPGDWGKDPLWKHNSLVLLPPYTPQEAITAIGTLKPEIESLTQGDGVLYHSVNFQMFGRSTTGKLAANKPVYSQMTIRNYNTAVKLATLLGTK